MKTLAFIIINAIILSNSAQCDEIYKWKDSQGNIHFGSQPPQLRHSIFTKQPIQQLSMTKPVLVIKTPKANKRSRKQKNKPSKCSQIVLKITQLEEELSTRQKADSFDLKNGKLNKLRWQKIKLC